MKQRFSLIFKETLSRETGLLFLLIFVVLLLFSVTRSLNSRANPVQTAHQQSSVILPFLSGLLIREDRVLLASQDVDLRGKVNILVSKMYHVNPNDHGQFEQTLESWLGMRCSSDGSKIVGRDYFVWTNDHADLLNKLGEVSRNLSFFASFEAVVPYKTEELAQIMDKVILLNPRHRLVDRYCEVMALLSKEQVAIAIVNSDEFHLIGSVTTGRITWLSANETRNITRENYVVKNLPYIMDPAQWFPHFASRWSFVNQETAAYQRVIKHFRSRRGLILQDKTAELGSVPSKFLHQCVDSRLESKYFKELCLK